MTSQCITLHHLEGRSAPTWSIYDLTLHHMTPPREQVRAERERGGREEARERLDARPRVLVGREPAVEREEDVPATHRADDACAGDVHACSQGSGRSTHHSHGSHGTAVEHSAPREERDDDDDDENDNNNDDDRNNDDSNTRCVPRQQREHEDERRDHRRELGVRDAARARARRSRRRRRRR